MGEHKQGLWITTIGVLFVVPDSLFIRMIDATAWTVTFWRGILSGLIVLLVVAIFMGRKPFYESFQTGYSGLIYTVLIALSAPSFVLAIKLTSVANVVLIIASMPVFAAIFSRLFLGEPKEEKQAGLDVDISPSPSQLAKSDTYRIVLSSEEDSIVAALNETVAAHPHVTFGSYPIVDNPEHKTIITLEGRFYNGGYTRSSSRLLDQARINGGDEAGIIFTKQEMDEHLANALEGLKSRLPDESILSIDQGDDLS